QAVTVLQDDLVLRAWRCIHRRRQIYDQATHRGGRPQVGEQRLADGERIFSVAATLPRRVKRKLGEIALHALGEHFELCFLARLQLPSREDSTFRESVVREPSGAPQKRAQRLTAFD